MDLNNIKRVSSAGYRLPDRSKRTRSINSTGSSPAADRMRCDRRDAVPAAQSRDQTDPVKTEELWKETVRMERRSVRDWEERWAVLTRYDSKGRLKKEEPLPRYVSFCSDHCPNTSNQIFGSRLSTPLGKELIRLNSLFLQTLQHKNKKIDPEELP